MHELVFIQVFAWILLTMVLFIKPKFIISVHGEYGFSPLEMRGDRLTGLDICNYMEKFSDWQSKVPL